MLTPDFVKLSHNGASDADDTHIIVPAVNSDTSASELRHVHGVECRWGRQKTRF